MIDPNKSVLKSLLIFFIVLTLNFKFTESIFSTSSKRIYSFCNRINGSPYYSPRAQYFAAVIDDKIDSDEHANGLWKRVDVPSPLHLIVDYNIERNSVVYEVSLGRDIGLDIVPGRNGLAVVGEVIETTDSLPHYTYTIA